VAYVLTIDKLMSWDFAVPVNREICVVPEGVLSPVNAVDPPEASSKLLPEVTAEKVDETPDPHVRAPDEIPQLPLLDDMVKLDTDPLNVIVARV
jgi:hypothetical protein